MDVKLPNDFNEELAEELAIHIGDGSMGKYSNGFLVSLAGHPIDDKEYYEEFIAPLMEKLYSVKVNLRHWSGAYGFQISSKELVEFKEKLGLPCGPKIELRIPQFIKDGDKNLKRAFLRGILDTDGTFYLENKNNSKYPRIQIRSISERLINEIREVMEDLGFKVSTWKETFKKETWKDSFVIATRGYKQINKWINEVGSSNPKNIEKFKSISSLK